MFFKDRFDEGRQRFELITRLSREMNRVVVGRHCVKIQRQANLDRF